MNTWVLCLALAVMGVAADTAHAQAIWYVDDDAPASVADGTSWHTAFHVLQDAFTAAKPGDELRIAQGTYRPDQGKGYTPGDKDASFVLKNAFPPNVPSCCCCPDEEEDPCYIGACYSSPLYRPLYNVHWANISGDFEIAENVPSICTDTSGESGTSPCLDYASVNAQSNLLSLCDIAGTPYCDPVTDPYCFPHWPGGDPDGTVNVDDLLGIINNWGACDGGSEPRYICRADIAPALGNGTVDVDDLLAVLNNWGDCRGGGIASAPDEVGDCFDYCESLSGQQWEDCMTRCLEAVCQNNPEECD